MDVDRVDPGSPDLAPVDRAVVATGLPDLDRFRDNLQAEIDGAALFRGLAAVEVDPVLAGLYGRMAGAEDRHAEIWRARLRDAGIADLPARSGWRTRVLVALARRFGAGLVSPTIVEQEQADSERYLGQPEARQERMVADERSHARLFRTIAEREPSGLRGGAIARFEGRHRATGGNALRAAVLGANDGLVSNASLVMGVAGADLTGRGILVTGLAGLLAGSLSMALGEWLSVQSARELYEHQIGVERDELEEIPEEEAEELALIYQAKGMPPDRARELGERLVADQAMALDTLAREELGIDPAELGGSAWVAASASFLLFSAGALVPVGPFIVSDGTPALIASVLLSVVALFVIGAGITLITGRGALWSGARQVVFGLGAAAITYGVGQLIGARLAG